MNRQHSIVLAVAFVLVAGGVARAALITGVTIENYSSQLLSGVFSRQAIHTIDGSGLSAGQHTNFPDAYMWLTNGTFRTPQDPLPGPYITFDLEGNCDLDSLHVWNHNEALSVGTFVNRGVNLVRISVASSEGGPFTPLPGPVSGNFTFAQAPGTTTYAGETIDLTAYPAADNTRLVRFDIISNHGGDYQFAGLSEVQFFGAATQSGAIPEPMTMCALGLAVAGLGGYIRKRRRA